MAVRIYPYSVTCDTRDRFNPTTSLDRNEPENAAVWLILLLTIGQINGLKRPHGALNRNVPGKWRCRVKLSRSYFAYLFILFLVAKRGL